MKIEEANKIIAEYLNDFSCHDCKNTKTEGGPKLHHQYETCTAGFYFDDIDECNKFELDINELCFHRSLNELIPVWKKANITSFSSSLKSDGLYAFEITSIDHEKFEKSSIVGSSEILEEAACIATAKSLKEIVTY